MEHLTGLVAVVMTFKLLKPIIDLLIKKLDPNAAITTVENKLDPNAAITTVENKPELLKLNQELEDYKQRVLQLEESHKFMEDLVYKQTVNK